MAQYAIPVTEDTLSLCEYIQGGPIPYVKDDPYFILVTDDPSLKYKMGVCPGATLSSEFLVLRPANENDYYVKKDETHG